ncbi:hypothetical protein HN011_005488 [Eciton burchellii]|nr:hypothetical protein HN011_005488 [Eciton burchellii]
MYDLRKNNVVEKMGLFNLRMSQFHPFFEHGPVRTTRIRRAHDAPKRKTGGMDQVGFRPANFSQKTAKRTQTSHGSNQQLLEEGCDKMALKDPRTYRSHRFGMIESTLCDRSGRENQNARESLLNTKISLIFGTICDNLENKIAFKHSPCFPLK